MGVKEFRWGEGSAVREGDYYFFYVKRENHQIGNRIFIQHRIVSGDKKVYSVTDRVSYIVLRGRWCNIIVINLHAPSE
jgi:hypothetical protein